MSSETDLKNLLKHLDGRGYKAYKDLQGDYLFPDFILFIDYVQGDPFASPSRLRARVPAERAGFPRELYDKREGRIALEDFLIRCFAQAIEKRVRGRRGTGKSGQILIDCGGQEILERSAMVIDNDYVEARFSVGLPARGRTILGKDAEEIFCREIPQLVRHSLFWEMIPQEKARKHISGNLIQENLRSKLISRKLIAFIADGSILPRESGISNLPMQKSSVIPFQTPPELSVTLEDPWGGKIRGMGIPEGVTLIVGGGYHGKSTLLKAIERGIYNHIPGDGREYLVSRANAVKIRAEDGRRVTMVDISPFINNLPEGRSTTNFCSEEASGSTSQATNIMEALEIGTDLLLVDEDTSATNFMIRDARMQALVSKKQEPITPFIDKVRSLYRDRGVSTLLVIGGSGDYFDVADTVIMMEEYRPRLVTQKAKEIANLFRTGRKEESSKNFGKVGVRTPYPASFEPRSDKKIKISARGTDKIQFGRDNIDLASVDQLVDSSQTRAIGDFILFLLRRKYLDGKKTIRQAIELGFADLEKKGLDIISPFYGQNPGEYAMPRAQEIAAAINRLRSLKVL